MKNIYNESSRYYGQDTIAVKLKDGRIVTAVKLRILPSLPSKKLVLKDKDRLDIIAQQQYHDPTQFWHVADANTALDASTLIKRKENQLTIIEVPIK